jgi:serine/threonine protein kinase
MKVECPKCFQRISISETVASSLAGVATFDCPSCGAAVPNPAAKDKTLSPDVAEQLLARALNSISSGGFDWIPPEPEELDRVIDSRYRIMSMLGHGGMGAVYKARDTRLDRYVAIKILPEEFADNPTILGRFEREAKSLAALDHPNIIKIHDFGFTSSGSPFFVMEFVKGNDIQSLHTEGKLDLRTALKMISQVCDAIDYAHRRKIIHRDIKPANVMISDEGVTKVADFGLAKLLESNSQPQHKAELTITGQVMGTPAYMAPEQETGAPVDHRTDIYSLGVMLYSLLTGTPPRGAWSLPSEITPLDERLDSIVLRALQEKPDARYQSASEFREDIDHVISDSGGSALPPGVKPVPLPSSTSTSIRNSTSTYRRFASAEEPPVTGKKTPVTVKLSQAESYDKEFLATTRSLNTTMLILGLVAMTVIGGLALFLANRKTGDTNTISQTITKSETHNTVFSQLITMGTNETALAEIGILRPYENGFIGVSKEALSESGATGLAQRTGSKILEISADSAKGTPLLTWLRENIAGGSTLRITRVGTPHLLVGDLVLPLSDTTSVHPVLLHWSNNAVEPVNSDTR